MSQPANVDPRVFAQHGNDIAGLYELTAEMRQEMRDGFAAAEVRFAALDSKVETLTESTAAGMSALDAKLTQILARLGDQ